MFINFQSFFPTYLENYLNIIVYNQNFDFFFKQIKTIWMKLCENNKNNPGFAAQLFPR